MEILPIGSIVRSGEEILIILGYSAYPGEEKLQSGYLVSKYPRGFAGIKSVGFLSYDKAKEVVFYGYKTDKQLEFGERMKELSNIMDKIETKKWESVLENIQNKK